MKKLIVFALYFITLSSFAQEKALKQAPSEAKNPPNEFELIKIDRLKRIHKELIVIRSEIQFIKDELNTDELDVSYKNQKERELEQLQAKYEKKRFLFIEAITNINLSTEIKVSEKTTFLEDIKQILDPTLSTFKKISERPRQIQEYSEKLSRIENRYEEALAAKESLTNFLKNNASSSLKWKIRESIKVSDQLTKKLKAQLEDLQYKIMKIEKNEESLVTAFSSIILDFIKTKGKNLFFAFMVFLIFFWSFKLCQAKFIGLVLFKSSRSENQEMYNWIVRPTRIIYNVVTTLISFFLAILTLYVLNDWFLVTLTLIIFTALIWSSKEYFPVFVEQSKIVLNLGSVREGERVMFIGLPWKIESLGYYCILRNPALTGAKLRINTKELLNSHSRFSDENEPWFPSAVHDWVEVEGVFGQVILQSPEKVIIRLVGGEHKFYSAVNYFNQAPINLSDGFSVEFIIGLDYSLQNIIFKEVLPIFKKEIYGVLYEKHPEMQGQVIDVQLGFKNAAASSLDLRFFMKCRGEMAHLKLKLERSLKEECVKICNENSYSIPFNQLSVHLHNES